MGLTNESQGGGNFLKVFDGEIRQKVSSETEGAVERTQKNGEVVYEKKFNTLMGTLKKIILLPRKREDYDDQWGFVINDGLNEYVLTLGYESGLACSFLFRLPNLNFERPLKLKTYWIEKNKGAGDYRPSLAIHQDGKKIERFFTKDEPHGLPEWKTVMISNKKHYDRSEMMAFLQKMVDEKVNPKLAELYPVDHIEKEPAEEAPPPPPAEDIDDLPF